jgi:hypothetical protein
MENFGNSPEQIPEFIDVSKEFLERDTWEFSDYLRTIRKVPELKLSVDLSTMEDRIQFIGTARRLKAFLESKAPNQKRSAKIIATEEQRNWEPNVFSSGVEFERK